MKTKMKKALALLLTIVMLMGLSVPAFAEEKPISYLALGDSTANGYGLQGFVYKKQGKDNHIDAAYIWQLGDYLESKLGKEVDTTNLALCGMRPNELAYFLDDSIAYEDIDAYGRGLYNGYTMSCYNNRAELTSTYQTAVKNADIITYDLGTNNFGNYMLSRITGIFGIDIGFSREGFYDDHFDELMAKNGFDVSNETVDRIRGIVEAAMQGLVGQDIIGELVDALLFSYASFCIGFRDSVNSIYELNPDVKMIVFGLANNLAGNALRYDGVVIDVGAVWEGLLKICNSYIVDQNEHNKDYMFADLSGGVETVIQAIGRGETYSDLNTELIELFYNGNVLGNQAPAVMGKIAYGTDGKSISLNAAKAALNSNVESPERSAALSVINTFMNCAAYDAPVDIKMGMQYMNDGLNGLKPLFVEAFTDYENASDIAKSATRLILNFLENGTGAHPSVYGHQQKLAAVEKAYDRQIAANGFRLGSALETTLGFFGRLFKSPDWLKTLKDMIKEFFEKLPLPIKFM